MEFVLTILLMQLEAEFSSVFCSYPVPQFAYTLPHINKHTFQSNNAIFNTTTQTHFFLHFLIKRTPKNRYTRKQPTHFSIMP